MNGVTNQAWRESLGRKIPFRIELHVFIIASIVNDNLTCVVFISSVAADD